jgi:hypothetical protein
MLKGQRDTGLGEGGGAVNSSSTLDHLALVEVRDAALRLQRAMSIGGTTSQSNPSGTG